MTSFRYRLPPRQIRGAKLIGISGNRCSITFDGVKVIKSVAIIGDAALLTLGQTVFVEFIKNRPIVLARGPSPTAGTGSMIQTQSAASVTNVVLSVEADTFLDIDSNQILDLDIQSAKTVFAGPASGAAQAPDFRVLTASDIEIEKIGTPTYDDVQDIINTVLSPGKISGGGFTDNGGGSLRVDAGTGLIKTSNSDTAPNKYFDWAQDADVPLVADSVNYIYVEYNGGTPQITSATSIPADRNTNILLGLGYYNGVDIHFVEAGQYIANYPKLTFWKDVEVNGNLQRVSGFEISETDTRNFAITAGSFYAGLLKKSFSSFNSSLGDTFIYMYRDGSGDYTEVAAQTQIDNLHYDDGSGALATLSNISGWRHYYGVHWVYVDADGHTFCIYGRGDYALTDAENATPPNDIPDLLSKIGRIVGKIIIEKNASSFVSVQSPFATQFVPTTVLEHNYLSALQGGTADEYYHLTSSEHTELHEWLDDVVLGAGGELSLFQNDGIDIGAAGDNDTDLITVNVAGAPKFWWDESDDKFAFTKPVRNPTETIYSASYAVTMPATGTDAIGAGTLSVLSANNVALANHLHAITTSSNPGANASILASDANGRLELEGLGIGASPTGQELRIDGSLVFVGTQTISTTIDHLILAPADDLRFEPGGDILLFKDLATNNWVSGLNGAGWGIDYPGNADFRSIYSEEIRTHAFVAEIYSAMAGALVITQSRAKVSRDFTIPEVGSSDTLYVEDLEGLEGYQVFTAGDYILLRIMTHGSGGEGLVVTDAYGTVASYTDLAEGEQSWTFTTTSCMTRLYTLVTEADDTLITEGGDTLTNEWNYSDSPVIYAGSTVMDYGQLGAGSRGVWQATVLGANAPYSEVQTWDTVTAGEPDNFTTWTRLGYLNGIAGVGDEYGLWAGQGTGDSDAWVLVSDQNVEIHNVPLSIHDGTHTVFLVSPTVPSYALGSSVPTGFGPGTGTGVWAGLDGGSYKWRVGDPSGIRYQWDGAALGIYDDSNEVRFRVDGDGAWLSNLAISEEFGQQYFTNADGLLLLGPGCPLTETAWTSLRGQEATISDGAGGDGAFHTVNGRWPGTRALMVEEATENLAIDPVCGTDIDSWAGHNGAAISRSATQSKYGGYSCRVVSGVEVYGGVRYLPNTVIDASSNYTVTVWVWLASVGKPMLLRARTDDSGNHDTNFTSVFGWQRVEVSFTSSVGDTEIWNVDIIKFGDVTDHTYYVDALQIEKCAYSTSFCYGGLPWCIWTGAVHNSTSTRAATEVNLDAYASLLSDNDTWSVSLWWQPQYDADADWPLYPTLFDVKGADNNNRVMLSYRTATELVDVYINGAMRLASPALTFKAGDWQHILLTFKFDGTDKFVLYVNGVEADSDATILTAPTALVQIKLGSDVAGANQSNTAHSQLALFDRVLTPAEVAAIYQSGVPLIDQGATDTPGIYILDGQFQLATSTDGARTVLDNEGWRAYNAGGNAAFALALVDGMGWDGSTLDTNDIQIGRAADHYIKWDDDAGTLAIKGSITITGGSGIANFTDAGTLATADNYGDIGGTPTSLSDINSTEGTKLGGIADNATVGATWGVDLGSIPTTLASPSGDGLFLSATHMGYYTGGDFITYIRNNGDFLLGDPAGAGGMSWNQGTTTLTIKGSITLTNTITAASISDVASGADVTADNAQNVAWLTDAGTLATADNLDDVPNGTTYSRVLTTGIAAGKILLTQVDGDLDDISNGTYGKVLTTSISAGKIVMSEVDGDLDDVPNGTTYEKVLATDITAGRITISAASISDVIAYNGEAATIAGQGDLATEDDLDGVPDGATWGRVAITDITAGHIVLTEVTGDLDDLADGDDYAKVSKTILDAGFIQVGAGTKDADLDGFHISATEIVGQLNGVDQVVMDTDGIFKAGGGAVVLDVDGVTFTFGDSTETRLKWTGGTPGASVPYISTTGFSNVDHVFVVADGFIFDEGTGTNTSGFNIWAGLNVGSSASGATDGDIKVQVDARIGGGLYVGSTGTDPDPDDIHYDGNLKSVKSATAYDVYGFHPLTTPITHTSFDGDSFSDVGTATKIENTSWSSTIPASAKALLIQVIAHDSGAGNNWFSVGPTSTWPYALSARPTAGNDYDAEGMGPTPCSADGGIYYRCEASGTGTLDVWLRCWGYWI